MSKEFVEYCRLHKIFDPMEKKEVRAHLLRILYRLIIQKTFSMAMIRNNPPKQSCISCWGLGSRSVPRIEHVAKELKLK